MMKQKESCTSSKSPLSKYLLGGMAVGALALSPFAVQAQEMTTTTTMTTTTMPASAEPMLVTGTVQNYWVDRAGFVSAMTVKTDGGVQTVRFSPSKAQTLYTAFPVGSTINVWVTPVASMRAMTWDARGVGTDKPAVWMPVNMTSDFDWLNASPYVTAGATNMNYSGKLKGVVINQRGDVIALAIDTDNGRALVRVPAELRQIARGHIGGSDRVASLFKNSDIDVNGMMEAPRLGNLSPYAMRIAANTIKVNGKNAGAIGIQMLPPAQRRGLLGFDIGGIFGNGSMKDSDAGSMGYTVYNASDVGMMDNGSMMTTTAMTTKTATGEVKIVTADNQTLPVVKKNGKVWAMMADGSMAELKKVNGKYMVPANMTGARMMMVMPDGTRMEMDTVNGQMMVMMADGSMAPVTLHTP